MTKILFFIIMASVTIFLDSAMRYRFKENDQYIYSEKSKRYLFYAYLIIIVFSVFRQIGPGGIGGTDANGYMEYFLGSTKGLIGSIKFQRYEPGYGAFIWFVRQFTSNYKVVLFIVHSYLYFSLIHLLKYVNREKYTFIGIFLIVALMINSFNITRVVLAVFITFQALILAYKKKYTKSLLVTLIAISVHISAAIVVPIIFILMVLDFEQDYRPEAIIKWTIIFFVIASLSIFSMDLFVTGTKYGYYQSRHEGVAIVSYLIIMITYVITIIQFDELIKMNRFNLVALIGIPIGLMILPFQYKYSIMYRMILYINPLLYIIIPQSISIYQRTAGKRIDHFLITLGLYGILFYKVFQFFSSEILNLGIPYIVSLF